MGDLRLCPRRPNGILRDDRLFMLSSTSSSSSSTSSSSSPPQPLSNPDPLSIGAECWAKAEQTTQEIVSRIHPTLLADQKRWAVIDYVRRLIKRSLGCEVFPYGSVPLKTYLPDGDIDLTTLRSPKVDVSLASDVHAVLEREQQNEAAEYEVKEVQFIDAEVKLVKCIVQNIVVDISFNQLGGLCTLCFLEQVNCLIAKDHIFKRSIILIKAWCFYESRILGAHHGLISTYALETLILYIFHLFHSSLDGPLAVLYRFLDYFSNFDWENYCISLKGPVSISSLPNTEAELLENGVDGLLLGEEFLNNCVAMFSVGRDSRAFPQKYLNIIDPLKENNNLGRSVHRGNSYRIRSAFKYGACKLGRILSLPTERMEDEIKKFFTNTLERHGSNYRFDVKNSVLCSGAKGSGSSSSTLSSMKMLSEGNQKLCTDFSCGNISRVTDGNTVRIRNRPVICLTKAATFPVSETDFPVYGNAVSEYRYSGDANELATTGFRHLKVTNDAPICSSSSSNLGSCFGNSHFSPHSKLAGLVTENEHRRQSMPANSLIDKDTGSISQFAQARCSPLGRCRDKMAASSVCRAAGRVLLRGPRPCAALLPLTRNRGAATYAQTLQNIPETNVTTLDNGLRVASEESSQPTCTVGVWIGAGSRYENEKNNGAGYFVEHLAFKGTKKRPCAAFEKEVESMGAHFNGYTSREQTAFYIKALSKDMPKVVELLADVVQNCALEESQIEKERGVILQELKEMDNDMTNVTFDYLHATAFQGTALARTVEGTTENIKHLTRADLASYIDTHFKAPRMVLAAAGGISHKELVDAARQHFSGVSFTYKEDAVPILPRCRFTGSEIRARDDALPVAHVALAVEGPGWADPDNVVLHVANAIIGRYDRTFGGGKHLSSRLAALAVEHKLCHSFQTFNTSYSDTGLFGFHFVADPLSIDDMMFCAQGEWMRLCTSTTESEVKRAKNHLRSAMVAQLDGTTPVCETIGSHLLNYGRRISLEEWDSRISAVDARMVRDVCSKYIYDKCPALAAVGPIEQLLDYNRIRSGMYWIRF